jgi:hypothetical protein
MRESQNREENASEESPNMLGMGLESFYSILRRPFSLRLGPGSDNIPAQFFLFCTPKCKL